MHGNWKKESNCPVHFPDFNLESSYDLTDFGKTVETGVNRRLAVITNVSRSLLS